MKRERNGCDVRGVKTKRANKMRRDIRFQALLSERLRNPDLVLRPGSRGGQGDLVREKIDTAPSTQERAERLWVLLHVPGDLCQLIVRVLQEIVGR